MKLKSIFMQALYYSAILSMGMYFLHFNVLLSVLAWKQIDMLFASCLYQASVSSAGLHLRSPTNQEFQK